jgi:hypothetical protein
VPGIVEQDGACLGGDELVGLGENLAQEVVEARRE